MSLTREEVLASTILLVRHGSHAYGLATETSDEDLKGICIPPLRSYLGLDPQFENLTESHHDGHPNDLVIYSLQKFARLACGANPTILEVLFIEDENVLQQTTTSARLQEHKHLFLSRLAYNSFCGYAKHQLHLVEKNGVSNAETRAKSWKNLSHTIRLLRMCNELLQTGTLFVRREDRDHLLDIKHGLVPLDQVKDEATILGNLCSLSLPRSPLPDGPDYEKINNLIVDMTKDWLYINDTR